MSLPNDRIPSSPSLFRPSPALGFDLMRAYLGVALFVRGILFISHPGRMLEYVSDADSWFLPYAITHYVTMAHLGGGVLLALGLATRLGALVQIPVLCGAVFFVHSTDGLLSAGQSLELSALVLMLLSACLVVGAGPLSVDAWLSQRGGLLGDDEPSDLMKPTTSASANGMLVTATAAGRTSASN